MTNETLAIGRRNVMGAAFAVLVTGASMRPVAAAAAEAASPAAPIAELDSALVATMKAGAQTAFAARYQTLQPVIARIFNLDAILATSVGLSWATLPAAEQAQLLAAFQRYTVSSYVNNFNSYGGQSFEILPAQRAVGNGVVVVGTQLLRPDKSPVRLDYVVRQGPVGWQVVDVLADGTISRVAVQRSDFRDLLMAGGVSALVAGLNRKVAALSGGVLA
ncbi:MAG TPA: ABC transporter substrate-binding protein [Rhodopila sp.]